MPRICTRITSGALLTDSSERTVENRSQLASHAKIVENFKLTFLTA